MFFFGSLFLFGMALYRVFYSAGPVFDVQEEQYREAWPDEVGPDRFFRYRVSVFAFGRTAETLAKLHHFKPLRESKHGPDRRFEIVKGLSLRFRELLTAEFDPASVHGVLEGFVGFCRGRGFGVGRRNSGESSKGGGRETWARTPRRANRTQSDGGEGEHEGLKVLSVARVVTVSEF